MALNDTVTAQELVDLGDAVRRIIEDKAVADVWSALEEAYYKQWKAATSQVDREILWAKVSALGDLRRSLQAAADTGQSTAHTLAQKAKDAEATRRD